MALCALWPNAISLLQVHIESKKFMSKFVFCIILVHLLKDVTVICAGFGHQLNFKKKNKKVIAKLV